MKSEEGDVVERRRLTACCWGEERSATCLVMLDEHGSLVDVLYLPSFSGPQRVIRPGMDYNIAEDPKKVVYPFKEDADCHIQKQPRPMYGRDGKA